jgi:C4-dicarboxylate-specific signal transduction histidine kinase
LAAGRLIIVDDEPVILRLLTTLFHDDPWELVACSDGAQAQREIEKGVDVLLTDKNLPDVGGLALLAMAKQRQPDCEVLIITGYASLDTALHAIELGAFDYIVKPPKNVFDVQRKVRQAFEKIAVVRENQRLIVELRDKNVELEAALVDLREVQAELIQSEKLAGIGTLAAGIAHEISSPLFGVMGLAEAIGEEDDLGLVHGYAKEIVEYSRNIKDIVVQLSGYSRVSEQEYLTTVDLGRVVEDAAKLVGRSTGFPTDRLVVVLGEPVYVNARTNELQQVFVNLVKNAVDAVRETHGEGGPGKVNVEVGHSEKYVWARVRDNGPGILEKRIPQIFDPFFTTKPPGKGTGLGLNIVYRIVTKYRGQVSVEETGPSGTTFLVRFPVESDSS